MQLLRECRASGAQSLCLILPLVGALMRPQLPWHAS